MGDVIGNMSRYNASVIHIYTICTYTYTQRVSLRPDPTAAAMCIAILTTPFYSRGISQTVPIRSVWVVHVEEVLFLRSY